MTDPWLPGAVITAVNLLILFGTMRSARKAELARVDAQVSAARATGYAARAERAAGMQSGKANGMDAIFSGGSFVVMADENPFADLLGEMSLTVEVATPSPEVLTVLFGGDPADVAPILVQTTNPGDMDEVREALQPYLTEQVRQGEIQHDGQGPPICEPCSAECPACSALRGGS